MFSFHGEFYPWHCFEGIHKNGRTVRASKAKEGQAIPEEVEYNWYLVFRIPKISFTAQYEPQSYSFMPIHLFRVRLPASSDIISTIRSIEIHINDMLIYRLENMQIIDVHEMAIQAIHQISNALNLQLYDTLEDDSTIEGGRF